MSDTLERMRLAWDESAREEPRESIWAQIGEEPQRWERDVPVCMAHILSGIPYNQTWSVLDLGCGIGRLTKPMAEVLSYVYGIDISPKMLVLAKDYLSPVTNVGLKVTDGRSIPLPDSSVHFAFSMVTLQHILSREIVRDYLHEVKRVLVPNGWAKLQTFIHLDDLLPTEFPSEEEGHLNCIWNKEEFLGYCQEAFGAGVVDYVVGVMYPNWLWVTLKNKEE